MLTLRDLYEKGHSLADDYLSQFTYPWEALDGIAELIVALGAQLGGDYRMHAPQVWVHETAVVAPTAYLGAPCIIGAGSEVRHCAYIRGAALIGANCVVGNATELKNVILFDEVQVPHYNYVGDSILGWHSHMGAGSITSNVKSDYRPVVIRSRSECSEGLNGEALNGEALNGEALNGEAVATGRIKVGAMLGDWVEIGCNSVLNPGTVIGPHSRVYPLSCVRGVVPAHVIYKRQGEIAAIRNDG